MAQNEAKERNKTVNTKEKKPKSETRLVWQAMKHAKEEKDEEEEEGEEKERKREGRRKR